MCGEHAVADYFADVVPRGLLDPTEEPLLIPLCQAHVEQFIEKKWATRIFYRNDGREIVVRRASEPAS
jgi:hypothetical protein